VLNSRKVGVVLNAQPDDAAKKVKAECWFDEALVKSVDVRVYNNIVAEKPTESSTGLFLNRDPVKGKFGDTPYDGIAREQNPDHLAILPDKVGALSVKMGGGLFANAEKEPESHRLIQQRTAENALKAVGIEFVGNELSFNTTMRMLSDVLSRTHGEKGKYWDGWVEDVFSGHVVFRDGKGKTWQQDYTANDKGVTLKGSAVEVTRTVSYKPVTANSAGDPNPQETKQMDRTATINTLIQNGGYTETDRKFLEGLTDDDLKRIKPVTANAATPPATPPAAPPAAPASNAAPTREQIAAAMGPEFMAVYNFGLQTINARKAGLITAIKGTGRCVYNDAALQAMTPDQLEALATIAGVLPTPGQPAGAPVANANPYVPGFQPGATGFGFPGFGGPVSTVDYSLLNGTVPVANAGQNAEKDDDGLEMPVVNFGKKAG
jgi:hypothetical protein